MKGQINIEFISAAIIYMIALFGLITVGSNVLPNFTGNIDQASLNMETYHITNQVLTQPGYSQASGGTEDWQDSQNSLSQITSFGLANKSGEFLELERSKIQKIQGFPRDQPAQYFNYSQFKSITGADNQYQFRFTWTPIVETHRSYNRGMFESMDSQLARYQLDLEDGAVEESWNDYNGETEANFGTGPERGVSGIDNTKAFRFNGDNGDYVISDDQIEIPQEYSIFTWIKADESDQNGDVYAGGFEDKVSLAIYDEGTPSIGLLIRNEADDGWHTVWRGGPDILDNEWHHLGATVDRDTEEVKIFVDGEQVHEEPIPDHWEGERQVILGSLEESDSHFTGKLDDFRIYQEELSAGDVEELYYEKIIPYIRAPNTDYYRSSENIVHFGNQTLNGNSYKFLVTAHNGVYDTVYVSDDWDFTGKDPKEIGQSFSLYGAKEFGITRIQQEGSDPGSIIVLNQNLKDFGPNVDSDSSVIRMDRYGILEGEPIRIEVLAW